MDESCGNYREFIPGLLRKINNLEDQLALYEANEYVGANEHLKKDLGFDCDRYWLLRNSKKIVICIAVCVGLVFLVRQW